MQKILITDTVIDQTSYDGPIKLTKKMIEQLQPDDRIEAGYVEAQHYSDSETPAYYYLVVKRKRLETDEEFTSRSVELQQKIKENRQKRYEQYVKLKKEFEP